MARKGEQPVRPARRRAPGDRDGVEQIEGIAQSFRWEERDTPEEKAMKGIFDALSQHPGRDARVRRFRTPEAAEEFAARLKDAYPALDVMPRGHNVFAKAQASSEPQEPVGTPLAAAEVPQ